jgi:hypothetical protein
VRADPTAPAGERVVLRMGLLVLAGDRVIRGGSIRFRSSASGGGTRMVVPTYNLSITGTVRLFAFQRAL